jgi:hypothetical protein
MTAVDRTRETGMLERIRGSVEQSLRMSVVFPAAAGPTTSTITPEPWRGTRSAVPVPPLTPSTP